MLMYLGSKSSIERMSCDKISGYIKNGKPYYIIEMSSTLVVKFCYVKERLKD